MTHPCQITAIEPLAGNPLLLEVRMGDTSLGTLPRDEVESLGMEIGLAEDDPRVLRFIHEVACLKARDEAFRMLALRNRSSGYLTSTLIRRGFSSKVSEQSVADLCADGWVDDAGYARARLDILRREDGRSAEVCRERLRKEGVPEEVLDSLLPTTNGDEDEIKAACVAIEDMLRKNPRYADGSPQAGQRIAMSLRRKGFDPDTMMMAIERMNLDVPDVP